ncbi:MULTISPECIES: putative HNHc nuclease [Liquorilactobacillus]|uniref:putative HNHc nuclease n=1 Tax=Liquorilactobacillus TaxID=2767888 RepID=UPI0039E90837
MWLPAFVRNFRGSQLVIQLEQSVSLERLRTMYNGNLSRILVKIEFVDPRKARPKQRALFFALIGDIWNWSGQPVEELKEYFYIQYAIKTAGGMISLADDTKNTVSDANKLLEIVIDFMFEFRVPFKDGYELLPKEESYYMYLCCKHRKCAICGRHADIHHLETIGMGGNRTHVDHTKRHVMALCREHHQEIETIHTKAFCRKYHLPVTGIKLDVETLRKIHVAGNYEEKE